MNKAAKAAGIILLVDRIEDSVEFYKKLGFIVTKEVPGTATTVNVGDFWVELLHKSKAVSKEYIEDIKVVDKGAGIYLQIQVENIDAFYETVLANGAQPSGKPENYPWHQREFIVTDPNGYKIAFFSPL